MEPYAEPYTVFGDPVWRNALPVRPRELRPEHRDLVDEWWRPVIGKNADEAKRHYLDALVAAKLKGIYLDFSRSLAFREIVVCNSKVWIGAASTISVGNSQETVCLLSRPCVPGNSALQDLQRVGGELLVAAAPFLHGMMIGDNPTVSRLWFETPEIDRTLPVEWFVGRILMLVSTGDLFFAAENGSVKFWHFDPYCHRRGFGIERRFESCEEFFLAVFDSVLNGGGDPGELWGRVDPQVIRQGPNCSRILNSYCDC